MLWKGKNKFSHIEVAPGGASYGFGSYNTLGRTYFVNNITGSATNDGLTWDRAMAQPSTAITASETYRQDRGSVTTNDYIRNTIVIQGTGTAYTQLTALPNYCDVIGLGGDPRGNGTGIARIGPDVDTGTTEVDGVNAGECRGSNFYNLQFQACSGKAAFDCDKMYRCRIENCAFMGNNDCADPSVGLLLGTTGTASFGASGLVVKDCHWGSAAATDFVIGISIAGTHFHNCLVENCHIVGVTGAVVAAGCVSSWNSMFKDNVFATGYQEQTASIDDNSTSGFIVYVRNYYQVKFTLAADAATRCFGNYLVNSTAPHEAFTDG